MRVASNPNPRKKSDWPDTPTSLTFVDRVLCLAGAHNWFEYEMDFFNPRNIKEECYRCGVRRHRFDKRKYRRTMWNNPNE